MKIAIPENLVRCLAIIQAKTGADEALTAINCIRIGIREFADVVLAESKKHPEVKKDAEQTHKDIMGELKDNKNHVYH
jgi:hypothetical protein